MFQKVFPYELVHEDDVRGVGRCTAECEASCYEELGGGGEIGCTVYDGHDFAFGRYKVCVGRLGDVSFLEHLETLA